MDASEKILRAFAFRLALLVLAVAVARSLPDNRADDALAGSIAVASVTPECGSAPPQGGEADLGIRDMYLHD